MTTKITYVEGDVHYTTRKMHINQLQAGDTIVHDGVLTTVCVKDIKRSSFMGKSVFGDSYVSGYKPVILAEIYHTKENN